MDAGIVDTINRRDVELIAARLDRIDADLDERWPGIGKPWYVGGMAETIMGENDATDGDRAWLVAQLAAGTYSGIHFDGHPADEDWENFYTHFRAEILARRDPQTPHARAAEICPSGVV
jgi:hypothetical protein